MTKKLLAEVIEEEGAYKAVRITADGAVTGIEAKTYGWAPEEKPRRILLGYDTELIAALVESGILTRAQGNCYASKWGIE